MFPWNSETPTENFKSSKRLVHQQPQTTSTCPWADSGTTGEIGSRSSSRSRRQQQQTSDTCPWGDVDAGSRSSSRSRMSKSSTPNTCPWGESGAADADTAHLARCEKLRHKAPVQFHGCAGAGAPKPAQLDAFPAQQDRQMPPGSTGYLPPLPPRAPSRDKSHAQAQNSMRMAPGSTGFVHPRASSRERNSFVAPAEQDISCQEPVASELECDPDAQERADLISKCLAAGLSDEQIEGVLREHMFQKMLEKEQNGRSTPPPMAAAAAAASEVSAQTGYQPRNGAQAPAASSFASKLIAKSQEHLSDEYKKELVTASKEAPPPECRFEPPKPTSVAAKRKARAASLKSVSFGPSDDEIVGILEGHATGRTPSPVTHEKAGSAEASSNPVAAYLQSQRQAAEAKNKNRNGSIIF